MPGAERDQGRRGAGRAPEAADAATAAELDPTVAALLAHVGLARLAADFAREQITAENIKHVEAADLAGLMAPEDARRIVEAARDYKSLEAYLARCRSDTSSGAVVRTHGRVPLHCNC